MISKKTFFGAAFGTMIEYYDYVLFSTFLPIVAPLFFPANTPYESLIKGYFVLLIAMIARPLGGLFFGYIGDTQGRPKALMGSIYGIAIATAIMALVPTYGQIGIWATIIIVVAKSMQLFCFGGEYNGAGIYLIEHTKPQFEGRVGSLLTATTLFGSLLASASGIIVTLPFMPAWSWRLAFLLGAFIGITGIFYRKFLLESPQFKQSPTEKTNDLFKKYYLEIIVGFFIGGMATIPFTTVITFILPVLTTKHILTSNTYMILQTAFLLIAILSLIPTGFLSDRFTPARVMKTSSLLMMLGSFPLLWITENYHFSLGSICLVILIVLNEFFLGPSHAFLKNLFPMNYRYRGASLGFCLGMSILGGLTPIVESYLYDFSGHFEVLALWLILTNVALLISMMVVEKKHDSYKYQLAMSPTID